MADLNTRAIPVLYLDIDGTVREGKDDPLDRFVNGPEDVRVFPEAVEMMRRWKYGRNGRIVGVSNQGGIALGVVDPNQVMLAMAETNRQAKGLFDRIAWCAHHPNADPPKITRCWCRKPRPGMLIEAATLMLADHPGETYPPHLAMMVGDRDEDRLCAEAANVPFQWAADWRERAKSVDGHH